jgi:Polysulphide reductase, NrfD
MNGVNGYMYPNEVSLYWSVLIVLYPYITGLVAGAFILASLVRIFHVEAVAPTYRLALLTALAFLIVAPLPLHFTSATQNDPSRCTLPRMPPPRWLCLATSICGI